MLNKNSILLQGGTLLIHDDHGHVIPTVSDILIQGSHIVKIAKSIEPGQGVKVIDVVNKLISPGFIDTHRHLYQTQLKGSHANHTIVEYMPRGNYVAALYNREDLFWGELVGAMESIDAGTTTVVDHSSCNLSPEYRKFMTLLFQWALY
jgi:cytosine/adenosine deaminase-related metal-dependent hydrolase